MRRFLLIILFCQFSFAQSDSILAVGQRLIYENKHEEALSYFNAQLLATNNVDEKTNILLEIAEIYKLQLNFRQANTYYIKVLEQIEKTGNQQLEFLYHVKMAEFYRKRTLFEKAVASLDRASGLLKVTTIEDAYLAKYYSRKAALSTEYLNNADSTLFYAKKSLQIAERIKDKDNIFYSKLEIATVFDRQKNYKKALEIFEELIEFAKKNNLIQHRADVYINYTRTLIKDKQIDKALSESLNAFAFAKKQNLLFNQILTSINIYNLYKAGNNLMKANEFLEYRLELTEKYYKLEHDKYLFELEEKYKVAEKEKQIEINKLELSNKDRKLASNKIGFYIILGLFAIVILIAFLIAYFLKKSKSTNKTLQFLSKQNEFLLSEANHRINNNLQLIIILISVQLGKVPEHEAYEIKKILDKINSIATLHRHLYQSNDKRNVNSSTYLNDVLQGFKYLFVENKINCNFKIDAIELTADTAMYLGLMITELCINSIKHAFTHQDHKEISFELTKENDCLHFYYADNGVGYNSADKKPKLIDQMCRQLKVDYKINVENGFSITFDKKII